MSLRIGSLFSGIGGLELGLEWSGLGHTTWQVEQDPNCLHWLAQHWPDAQRHTDVCTVGAHILSPVDVICGGFPCQDISYAGKGAGLDGHRSGLWYEFARIIGELGPGYVVVENVAALFTRGIDQVLGTLADIGYDAEWSTLRASDVGAPHRRERVFIIAWRRELANATSDHRRSQQPEGSTGSRWPGLARSVDELGHTQSDRRPGWANNVDARRGQCTPRRTVSKLGDTTGERFGEAGQCGPDESAQRPDGPDGSMEHAERRGWGTRDEFAARQLEQGREGLGDAREPRPQGHAGNGVNSDESRRHGTLPARSTSTASLRVGWHDATPARGCDGAVRLIPREAAETGPESTIRALVDGFSDLVAGRINADALEANGAETVRTVRDSDAPDAAHEHGCLCAQAILFAFVCQYESEHNKERIKAARSQTPEVALRGVRCDECTRCAPHRREPAEQLARELTDRVSRIPNALASQAAEAWHCYSRSRANLWPIAVNVPGRVARLRAIGNAVVPQCAEIVGRRLAEIIAEQARAPHPAGTRQ